MPNYNKNITIGSFEISLVNKSQVTVGGESFSQKRLSRRSIHQISIKIKGTELSYRVLITQSPRMTTCFNLAKNFNKALVDV